VHSGAPMRHVLVALGLAILGAAGCVLEDPDIEGSESDMSETLTLHFVSIDGALSLKSSGKLLTCPERFEGLDGERIGCSRDGEKVQVIVKSTGTSVVAVRDLGKQRGYYTCSPSGDLEGLPASMSCKITTIHPRGSGGLSSPFDSTVPGVSVPNSHWVDEQHIVLRGMEPRTEAQFDELRATGIARVLIFKNATGNDDVATETAAWALPADDLLHVPFRWTALESFQTSCEQTVEALRFIRASAQADKKVFFHCTVGEDRTGYLAALYALVFEGADAQSAFDLDMCEHGYGSGNPQKPGFVVGKLQNELTPLYRSMVFLVHQGLLKADLDAAVCATEPEVPDEFMSEPLTCGVSTTLVP
jgi:hypothetical protein